MIFLRLVKGSRPVRTSQVEFAAYVRDREWVRKQDKRSLKELVYQLLGLACLWLIGTWLLWF